MGLDVSHGAYNGGYISFGRFRHIVAKATGGSFPPHEDRSLDNNLAYIGDGYSRETHPGLYAFLEHSDCEGEISPELCIKLAYELEALLPKIEALDGSAGGHISKKGGFVKVTKDFIAGCRLAHERGEPLIFD